MIKIQIKPQEVFNNATNEFVKLPGGVFRFEHSLRAISKWETKWCIPFLDHISELTQEQALDYYTCMCMDEGFDKSYLTLDVVDLLNSYMEKKATATTITTKNKKSGKKQILTSELLYAYMSVGQIPYTCDKWHIERLIMLIECISILQSPDKKSKRSNTSVAQDFAKRNAERLAKYGTEG